MYFFIIELLDRTLRDRMRSERITKVPVMGCFPKESTLRYRRFNKTIADMALRQLSKELLPHFKEGQQNVLNLLSTDAGNGKSFIAQELENYWISIGLQVRRLTYDEDFLAEDSRFILANGIKDICRQYGLEDAEIVITAFSTCSRISKNVIRQAAEMGIKVGMIRPITLWPFPSKIINETAALSNVKAFLDVELSAGQMVEDVELAVSGKKPVHFYGRMGGNLPTQKEILDKIIAIHNNPNEGGRG